MPTHANDSDTSHANAPAFVSAENRDALVREQQTHQRIELLERTTVATGIPNLRLVALTPDDANALYDVVDRNREHLTQHGDYSDLGQATPESAKETLNNPGGRNVQLGIWLGGRLIGRADPNPRTRETSSSATGSGESPPAPSHG